MQAREVDGKTTSWCPSLLLRNWSAVHFCHRLTFSQGCLFPAVLHMWTGCQFSTGLLTQASVDILHMHVFGRGGKSVHIQESTSKTPHRKTVGQNWTDNLLARRVRFQPLHHRAIAEPHVHTSVICVHPQLSLIFSGCLTRRSHRGDRRCSYHHPNCGVANRH